jgi:rhamnosyltransferase
MKKTKNIVIIGSRGLFKNYGGWEYYLNNLLPILSLESANLKFHVINFNSNLKSSNVIKHNKNIFIYEIPVKKFGNMLLMDLKAYFYSRKLVFSNKIVYFLGVRVGIPLFFFSFFLKKKEYWVFNPAGLEWLRTKFNILIRLYLYISAFLMSKSFDFIISDSFNITKYYIDKFRVSESKITTIPYGVSKILESNINILHLEPFNLVSNEYYLIVSRLVSENSYEMIINSFILSNSSLKLVIVSNFSKETIFFRYLNKKYNVSLNPRIILIDSLYNNDILNSLRFHSIAYINGNQLGGTNPGLLHAMVTRNSIIAYKSVFAREVLNDNAYYFSNVIELTTLFKSGKFFSFRKQYNSIINTSYLWEKISNDHLIVFDKINND